MKFTQASRVGNKQLHFISQIAFQTRKIRTQDIKVKIQNTQVKTQNIKVKTQNTQVTSINKDWVSRLSIEEVGVWVQGNI